MNIHKLTKKAQISAKSLNDVDIAKVFLTLMEFPLEDYSCEDLLNEIISRESAGSYEIARALAVYFSELSGDLFWVSDGKEFYSKYYLRGMDYMTKALKVRREKYNPKNKSELEASWVERDFNYGFATFLDDVYEWKDVIKDELEKKHTLFKQCKEFIKLEKKVSEMNSPSEVLQAVEPHWDAYVLFTRQVIELLPEDE